MKILRRYIVAKWISFFVRIFPWVLEGDAQDAAFRSYVKARR